MCVHLRFGYGGSMSTAKVFKNGNSQAVRLPKEFQFDVSEVEIFRRGDETILRKKPDSLKDVFDLLAEMPNDFFAGGRVQPPLDQRDEM